MRILSLLEASICWVLAAALTGCGGAETPPPKVPEAKPEPVAKAKAPPAEDDENKSDEADSNSNAGSQKDESKPAGKAPRDVIGDPELVFMFSFKDSDIRQKKEDECDKRAKDDERKKADCMSKAQGEVEADGIRFAKDDKGDSWYVVFRRQANKLTELNRIKYTIGKETKNQITLALTGRDMGKKPMAKVPTELVVDIVDDYSIALADPAKGKMVYRGKTGLLSDSSTKDR